MLASVLLYEPHRGRLLRDDHSPRFLGAHSSATSPPAHLPGTGSDREGDRRRLPLGRSARATTLRDGVSRTRSRDQLSRRARPRYQGTHVRPGLRCVALPWSRLHSYSICVAIYRVGDRLRAPPVPSRRATTVPRRATRPYQSRLLSDGNRSDDDPETSEAIVKGRESLTTCLILTSNANSGPRRHARPRRLWVACPADVQPSTAMTSAAIDRTSGTRSLMSDSLDSRPSNRSSHRSVSDTTRGTLPANRLDSYTR